MIIWILIIVIVVLVLFIILQLASEGSTIDDLEQQDLKRRDRIHDSHVKKIDNIFFRPKLWCEISETIDDQTTTIKYLDKTKYNIIVTHGNKLLGYKIDPDTESFDIVTWVFSYITKCYLNRCKTSYTIVKDTRFCLELVSNTDNTDTISIQLVLPTK